MKARRKQKPNAMWQNIYTGDTISDYEYDKLVLPIEKRKWRRIEGSNSISRISESTLPNSNTWTNSSNESTIFDTNSWTNTDSSWSSNDSSPSSTDFGGGDFGGGGAGGDW
jgi:uncharacterized membrane protein YgcG